jgi:glycosyltransferase involved in cell wall biosynthesis
MKKVRQILFEIRALVWGYGAYFCWTVSIPPRRTRSRQLKHITHINTDDQSGGAARVARDIGEYQRLLGYSVKLLVGNKRSENPISEAITAVDSRKQRFLGFAQSYLDWQDFFHLSSFDLLKNPVVQKADIVHLHNLHGNYFSYLALPILSRAKHVVWSIHDMHPFTGHCSYSMGCTKWRDRCGDCPSLNTYPSLKKDTTSFIRKAKARSFRLSELHIVALSKWMENFLRNSILKDATIHQIYNGIDTSVFYPRSKAEARNLLGLPSDKFIFLFSANQGSKNPFKGGEYLNQLVKEYEKKDEFLFLSIGGYNDSSSRAENCMEIPYISDSRLMALYYAAADIYLYPSLADNCPLVVLEAMGSGTPVLAFDTGGTAELVIHEKTGYIARYKDGQDLTCGLEWLYADRERLNKLAEAGVTRVQKFFSLETMNNQYLELYKKILSG